MVVHTYGSASREKTACGQALTDDTDVWFRPVASDGGPVTFYLTATTCPACVAVATGGKGPAR